MLDACVRFVALGRNFGAAFFASPPPAPSSCSAPFGDWTRAGRGRGRGIRKVAPKFLPRATQDASFSPGGCGLRRGGEERWEGKEGKVLEKQAAE